MYSGLAIRKRSGRAIGIHQHISRLSKRQLISLPDIKATDFPSIKDLIFFEGRNGPDGIKRKSPLRDEPWHFIDPDNQDDVGLLDVIDAHMNNLVNALAKKDNVKSAFEAAWLAHAVVDGLTPAHHYPLGKKIEQLHGKSYQERCNKFEKVFVKGKGLKDTLKKNWDYIGIDGVMTAHLLFEFGVVFIGFGGIKAAPITSKDLKLINKVGHRNYLKATIEDINKLRIYEEFAQTGWTVGLGKKVRKMLLPVMIKTVTLMWYRSILLSREVA